MPKDYHQNNLPGMNSAEEKKSSLVRADLPRIMQRWLKHLAIHAENCPEIMERLPREALDVDDLAMLLDQLMHRLDAQDKALSIESAVFDNVSEGIVVTDANGVIQKVNRAYSQMTGYTQAEVEGKRPGDFLKSGVHGPDFYKSMWSEILTNDFWHGEIWNRRKNGEAFLETLSISTVKNAEGKIINLVGVFGDITDLRRIEHKLKQLNHYDSLTNLPNRTLIMEQLARQILQANRGERIFGLVSLDLDHFKKINNKYGNQMGDELLLEVANRLHSAVRDGDIVGRLGGDEFVIIMTNLKDHRSLEVALARLREQLAVPFMIDETGVTTTTSMGATVYPEDNADAETLMRHASQAMMEAKQRGRNCYQIFDPKQEENARFRREQMERLREALHAGEMRLYYQPKINLRTGKTVGAEALIRWQHPEQGLLFPASFLPFAEDNNLMIELGDWVIETALDQVQSWNQLGLDLMISVNVSALQLQQSDFVSKLEQALRRRPSVRKGQIELEILESSIIQDMESTRGVLHACLQLGVGAALDDFGTGYSSLTYLKQIPATTLKIDQSFVRNMLGNREDLGLVEGIISLARIFEMSVVAEGMETPEHGVLLLRIGCDTAQGYGIAKAMPPEEFPTWIQDYQPDPSWATWANIDWDLSDFPLIVAQYDHIDWVRRIMLAMESNCPSDLLSENEVRDHRQCRLGKWYYGRGRSLYGHLPEFQAIEDMHREIHRLGPRVLELSSSGDKETAHTECLSLLALKSKILDSMQSLQKAVASQAKHSVADNLPAFRPDAY